MFDIRDLEKEVERLKNNVENSSGEGSVFFRKRSEQADRALKDIRDLNNRYELYFNGRIGP